MIEIKNEIKIPILGIIIAELLLFIGKIFYGLGIHIVNFLIIILIIVFSDVDLDDKNILQSLILLIILRLVNLSMPQFFTNTMLQYPLIYGVMFIPIYYLIKEQKITAKELGINFEKLYIYIPAAILIGIMAAQIEYKILNPIEIIKLRITDIILISIIMFLFIGTVEELIFRPILQTRIEKVLGFRNGILISGMIFGIMHAGYGKISEIMFAGIFGIFLGYLFYKTKSLPFIVSIHGIANVVMFGVLPSILR